MGFLGGLFQKKKSADPLAALRERSDENPNDARLASELANQLKAIGDLNGAHEYARRAAQAHRTAGFTQKALAVLKGAVVWGQPSMELLQDLADVHIELKHKEDARGTLIQLRKLHASAGNKTELGKIDAQLLELGPGR
jgi:tetratricopeptide (TPR) repeat protein